MAKKNDNDKLSELQASFNGDLLKENPPQYFNDDSIRVERILLDMVRPDPIHPRHVLPEKVHLAFHENRLTPSQALREMVQVAQVAARQLSQSNVDGICKPFAWQSLVLCHRINDLCWMV